MAGSDQKLLLTETSGRDSLQLVEADITQANRVICVMYTFIELMHSMLVEKSGLTQIWGRVRFPDTLISLQWLYEDYPLGNQIMTLDTMSLLESRGFDWLGYWTEENFIFVDIDTIQDEVGGESPQYPFVHGVNAAQGLNAGATIYRFTGNDSILQNNRNGVNWTFSYPGDPAGSVIGDKRESGLNANRGTQFSKWCFPSQNQGSVAIFISGAKSMILFPRDVCRVEILPETGNTDFAMTGFKLCITVETMYLMSYLYHTLGDDYFGDRCERAAFNALPASILARPLGSSIPRCS